MHTANGVRVRTPNTGQQCFKRGLFYDTDTKPEPVCSHCLLTLHEYCNTALLRKSPLYRMVLTLCFDADRKNGSRI